MKFQTLYVEKLETSTDFNAIFKLNFCPYKVLALLFGFAGFPLLVLFNAIKEKQADYNNKHGQAYHHQRFLMSWYPPTFQLKLSICFIFKAFPY